MWRELEARAGPSFLLGAIFQLQCTTSVSVTLTQGCHHTWLLAGEGTAGTCQSHTWLLAPSALQSGQPCCILSATGTFVSLTSDLYTHSFSHRISIKVLCVMLMASKVSRATLVHRSWLPLSLGSSSSDLAGTSNHPGYFNKGNSQSCTQELLSLFGQVTNWRLCEVNTHSDKLLFWCQT